MDYDYIDMIVEEFKQILFENHWDNELVDYWFNKMEDGHGGFVIDVPPEIFECVLAQAVKNVNGLIKYTGGNNNEIEPEEKDRELGEENCETSSSDSQERGCEGSSDGYRRIIEQLCTIRPVCPSWFDHIAQPVPACYANPIWQNCSG